MTTGFHAPDTIDGVLELCSQHGEDAWILGGGTDLNALGSPFRSGQLISLHRLGLETITSTAEEIVIGACCTLQQLVETAEVPEPVRAACRRITNRTIRNQATIGGHVAAAHRYASVTPMLVALGAGLDVVTEPGTTQRVPVSSQASAPRQRLITAVRIPRPPASLRAETAEHRRSANDLPMLTVAVALRLEDRTIREPAVVLGSIVEQPRRLEAVEAMLRDGTLPAREAIEAGVGEQLPALEDDLRASARFKRYLAGVLVADALGRAVGRAS